MVKLKGWRGRRKAEGGRRRGRNVRKEKCVCVNLAAARIIYAMIKAHQRTTRPPSWRVRKAIKWRNGMKFCELTSDSIECAPPHPQPQPQPTLGVCHSMLNLFL